MLLEIRPVDVAEEASILEELDRKTFPPGDRYSAGDWGEYETCLFLKDGEPIGACAFMRERDLDKTGEPTLRNARSLFIVSTGVLPEYQGRGYGEFLKIFELIFARENGFHKVVSTARESNIRIINLNKKLGFRIARKIKNYYRDPMEDAVVMEFTIKSRKKQKRSHL